MTDTKLSKLILNVLTKEQYDSANKNEEELYLTPDTTESEVWTFTLTDGTSVTKNVMVVQ